MLWHAMPPELNTARLMAGAGPAPMLAAAAGWQTLSAALDAQAVELTARLNSLGEAWTGGGSDKALAAATPMVVWLQTASTQAKTRAMQATAQAAAYTQAMATTPSLPEIAANHITQAVLTATNFFGINTIPIALTEMDYFIRMWNQAALAMEVYQAETAVNTLFEKLEPMASILDPGASQSTTNPIFGMPSPGSSTPVGQLPPAATQTLGQLGEMSGPMQQLTQPLQRGRLGRRGRLVSSRNDNRLPGHPGRQWNFAGIEAAASAIQGNVTSIHSLLDEGKQSLTKLAAAWGGSGSEAYQGVQQKWDATATELNNALQNLARTISEAGQAMASTEGNVTGMFA